MGLELEKQEPRVSGGWQGVFLCIISGPPCVISLHGVVWVSLQHGVLRVVGLYMVAVKD